MIGVVDHTCCRSCCVGHDTVGSSTEENYEKDAMDEKYSLRDDVEAFKFVFFRAVHVKGIQVIQEWYKRNPQG